MARWARVAGWAGLWAASAVATPAADPPTGSPAGVVINDDWRAFIAKGQLVEIAKVDPTIRIEMRYTTPRNCVGTPIEPADLPCLLRPEAAVRLRAVQTALRAEGYGLKVWDAYRPPSAQRAIWNRFARHGYVADPGDGRGSLHSMGVAVDVTLVDAAGHDVTMPSSFDTFSPVASGIYRGSNLEVRGHLLLLQHAMFTNGFAGLSTEWWHFVVRNWRDYDPTAVKSGSGAAASMTAPQ